MKIHTIGKLLVRIVWATQVDGLIFGRLRLNKVLWTEGRMKVRLFLFVILLASPVSMLAQQKARGLSPPGSIGRNRLNTNVISSGSVIICTVSFEDPSGDAILNRGEKASLRIFVRNYSEDAPIRPKLEIILQSMRTLKTTFRMKTMDQIDPGQAGAFTDYLVWNDKLTPGQMTYKVRVFDSASGFRSKTAQVSFEIDSHMIRNPEKGLN